MNLIDSAPVVDAAQTLRDLTAGGVAVVSAPTAAPSHGAVEFNGFASLLDELAKIRDGCEHAHAYYSS